MPGLRTKKEVVKVGENIREITTISDEKGNIVHRIVSPLMIEFNPKDVLQVIIGAAILSIPVGYTEETWNLGQTLPIMNVIGFLVLSLVFISTFVYYNYYVGRIKGNFDEFAKRVLSTYILSFFVVGILLTLIQRAPWTSDFMIAFKRTVIVTFPASMSAAVADTIK